MSNKDFVSINFPYAQYSAFHERDKTAKPKNFIPFSQLDELNKGGYGIYFTANEFVTSRTTEAVVRLRMCYIDFDITKNGEENTKEKEAARQALLSLTIKPNYITTTRNGIQPLWVIDEEPTEENKERYKLVEEGLIAWSKEHGGIGDPVKDIARVLRAPGFYHRKQDPPTLITIGTVHETPTTLKELQMEFPYFDPKVIETHKKMSFEYESKLDSIDIREVTLKAISEWGHPEAEFDKTDRIWLERNEKMTVTGAFQGRTGDRQFIASHSHQLPSGNKVTFVANLFQIDNKAAYEKVCRWFDLWEERLPQRMTPAESKNLTFYTPQQAEAEYTKKMKEFGEGLKTGFRVIDKCLSLIPQNMYVVGAHTHVGKTTFLAQVAINVAKTGKEVLFIPLEQGVMTISRLKALNNNEDLPDTFTILDSEYAPDPQTLLKVVKGHHKKFHLICLDHIHYFKRSQTSQTQSLDEIMLGIQTAARVLNIPIIAASHLRKPKDNRLPSNADLKDSASISQIPSVIILLSRDENELGIMQQAGVMRITKNRISGRMSHFQMNTDGIGRILLEPS